MASEKVKYPLLSDDNYHAWARRTRAGLEQRRLWEAIDPGYDEDPEKLTPKQRKRDTDALNSIIQVVEDQYLNHLDQCARDKTAWEILESIHCNFGILHIITMLEELVTIKEKDNMSMHEYMGKIQSCNSRFMLRGLPREIYEGLIRSLVYDEESLSVKMVRAILLLEERRQNLDKAQESSELKSFMSKMNPRSITGNIQMHTEDDYRGVEKPRVGLSYRRKFERPGAEQRNIMCYVCNEIGHIARVCPKVTTEEKNNNTKPDHKIKSSRSYTSKGALTAEVEYENTALDEDGAVAAAHFKALCADKLGRSCKSVWIMDFGTIHHMTPYRELIEDFDSSLTGSVKHANGEFATAKGKGRIKDGDIKVMDGNEMVFKAFSSGCDVSLVPFRAYKANGNIVKCASVKEVKILKKKSDVAEAFKQYESRVEIFQEKKIMTLQSDNGGENICKEFEKHLRDKGILHKQTVPCSLQQNGKVERLNQTLMNMARCPLQAINEQIPFQLWFDQDLTVDDIKHIYIFGCQVWAATLENGKLSSRADECIFLEFHERIKGYRLWRLSDKRIIVSREVRFYEHIFPFKTPCPAKLLVHEQENVVEMPAVNLVKELRSVQEAIHGSDGHLWLKAMEEEIGNLRDNNTWTLVKRPIGNISPVIKRNTLRILMSLAVQKGLFLRHIDVTAAYLNSPLTSVNMTQPSYWEEGDGKYLVCLLKRSIYGLHQAVKDWFEYLSGILKKLGLKQCLSEPCVLVREGLIIGMYVYDLVLVGNNQEIIKFTTDLDSEIIIKDMGEVSHLLGYLKYTSDLKLTYSGLGSGVEVFCDADWANDKNDSKSIGGYVVIMGGEAVCWKSKKQQLVATPTVEAE
ncbi:hypothetical protein PR048_017659 [Dryococelus australis]|uniref:Uncharacterized protein n=1 Tax=Dryococelus australis TaxID=614101 RepID=A0ABQ9HAB2_9NEOP|nr:hypothetical protein PR048_017659 [Dryococelus australis]